MKFGDKITLKRRKIAPKSKTKPSIALWTQIDDNIKLSLEYSELEVVYVGIWERNNAWHIIWNLNESILQIVSSHHFK